MTDCPFLPTNANIVFVLTGFNSNIPESLVIFPREKLFGLSISPNPRFVCQVTGLFSNYTFCSLLAEPLPNQIRKLEVLEYGSWVSLRQMCSEECCAQEVKCCCIRFGLQFLIKVILKISIALITVGLVLLIVYLYGGKFWKQLHILISRLS